MRSIQFAGGPRVGSPWAFRLTACLLVLLYALVVLGALRAFAQEPAAPPQPSKYDVPADLEEVVQQQFGACFHVAKDRGDVSGVKYLHPQAGPPWVQFLAADLDGDGVEDAIIVARCPSPFADAAGYDYKVIDPYFANYGYGNPRVTSSFSAADPPRQNLILIIEGSGKEGWRAAKPKAKFAIINAPFDSLRLTRVPRNKKQITTAIALVETEGLISNIFWDGKKWKWQEGARGQ